ncbi:MAG TPA: VWA domain-containing protein [Pyrinomonadaceae bacterium]|nr:VWA domain-containing protein [Pyrinomonadaceae bacterium]
MRPQRRQTLIRVALVSFLVAAAASALAQTPPAQTQQPQPGAAASGAPPTQAAGSDAPAPSASPGASAASGSATTTAAATTTATAREDRPRPAGPPLPQDEKERIIIHSDLISLNVTVTDMYGRFVTGLGRKAFTVFDDKVEQEIVFFSDEDAPVSLGVVFDVSGSMSGDKIQRAREALTRFVDTSHHGDEYFLIGFNHRAQLLLDKTRDSDALTDKLTFVSTKGQTALYDACYLGVEKVTRGAHQKRAVLLISDGQDNSSRYTFSELRRLLKETDVIIYAIGINDGPYDSTLDVSGRAILEELSGVSGGKAFFPNSGAEMNDVFERIALELRTQYSIGYRPSNFANDGKWHKLKVRVQPPRGMSRLFVRSKEGYYSLVSPR